MKILFVTMDHYPYSGACSSLVKKMTDAMQEEDMDIQVLAAQVSPNECVAKFGGVTVHRVWRWNLISTAQLRKWRKTNFLIFLHGSARKLAKEIRVRVFKQEFQDGFEVHAILRKLVLLANEQYDVIIPVAGHYESVNAVLRYKKRQNTKVVIYQVDPCATNMGYSDATKNERMDFEKRMWKDADAIITTPILLREAQNETNNRWVKKLIPMEFPNVNTMYNDGNKAYMRISGSFNCVFAGNVYRQARNPAYTFRLFVALRGQEIRLHMVGVERRAAVAVCGEESLADNIDFCGTVSLEQAQQYMEDADILVNIGNIMTNQVPSKIFEYISAGKPIVNICTSHECPTLPYLEKYPYVLNLFECDPDFDEQVNKLEAFIKENAGKRVPADYIMKTYETCTAQYCAKQMIDVIKKVVGN